MLSQQTGPGILLTLNFCLNKWATGQNQEAISLVPDRDFGLYFLQKIYLYSKPNGGTESKEHKQTTLITIETTNVPTSLCTSRICPSRIWQGHPVSLLAVTFLGFHLIGEGERIFKNLTNQWVSSFFLSPYPEMQALSVLSLALP